MTSNQISIIYWNHHLLDSIDWHLSKIQLPRLNYVYFSAKAIIQSLENYFKMKQIRMPVFALLPTGSTRIHSVGSHCLFMSPCLPHVLIVGGIKKNASISAIRLFFTGIYEIDMNTCHPQRHCLSGWSVSWHGLLLPVIEVERLLIWFDYAVPLEVAHYHYLKTFITPKHTVLVRKYCIWIWRM